MAFYYFPSGEQLPFLTSKLGTMLQDLERPLPPPSPAAIPSTGSKTACQSDATPSASLPDRSDLIYPVPEAKHLSPASSHRRANTEIISRHPRLPVRQLFANQSTTLEDCPAERTAGGKLGERAKLLSDWFQGKSVPVNFGLSRQPSAQGPTDMDDSVHRSSHDLDSPSASLTPAQKRMTSPSPLKQVTASNSFSFFGLKRQGERKEKLPEPADDELLNLDVTAALFPPGSSDLNDQGAFDTLRNNADNIVRQLQGAYKQRTFALYEAMADKDETQEELEETKTLMAHLKTQLDGMAERVFQQDKAIKSMAEDLEQERQLRQKENEAHCHFVVKPADDDTNSDLGGELRAPTTNFKRASNCTLASDSGFESGDESIADSVFSRESIGSPRSTITAPSPNLSQIALPTPTSAPMMPAQKDRNPIATPRSHQSAYDRVLKGIASSGLTRSRKGNISNCTNCHGVPASEAWGALGVLKDENKGLKVRVGELEMVIDDCLSVVGP